MKPNRHNVTLRDIAAQTGFSVNTVSRALCGKPEIARKTRETILAAAQEMGHIRNMLASSLRSGVSKTIAVILGDVSNPHFAIMMSEIEHHARSKGYTSFLINTDEDEAHEFAAIQTALNQSVDGIIICPCQKSTRNVEYLQGRGVPFVLIGRRYASLDVPYVVCNDELGGYQAAQHLIKAGHREILLMGGPNYISSAAERRAGYLRALSQAGIPCRQELMAQVPVTANGCAETLEELKAQNIPFTAIFAFSDIIAWKCWSFLARAGLRVPQDVSIIGFDYIHSRLELPVQLTSISSKKRHMSTAAVDLLLACMGPAGAKAAKQLVIDTTLIIGQTVCEKPADNR